MKLRAFELFPAEVGSLEAYRALIKRWHPDANSDPRATEVFSHVTAKFSEAKRGWVHGTYPNTLTIRKKVPGTDTIAPAHYPYLGVVPFELGELYVCERHVIWATRRSEDDLAKRWLDTVKDLKFPNATVEAKVRPFLPQNSHTVANGDRAYTICQRPEDYIRVADILAKKGAMDPRHVAWTLSRAYKIAGYLNYARIQHLDVSPETMFIDPVSHLGALLGGWFYTASGGQKLLAVPARTAHLRATETNLDAQIKMMGRRMLGASSPGQLRANKSVPDPLKSWLLDTPRKTVHEAERDWKGALVAAFGKRRFTEYNLTTAEVYSA